MIRRVFLCTGLLVLAFSGIAGAYLRLSAPGPALTDAGEKFLASLSEEQRSRAQMAYDAPERVDWHFIPKDSRKGLQIKEMNDQQRHAAHALLRAGLSEMGYDKAVKIMALESILQELEKGRQGGPIRDPERYYFTIFGQPGRDGRWGASIEGHHLSLNFVVSGDEVVSSTPAFFGANPAIVMEDAPGGMKKGDRVLALEETLAFDLLGALNEEQRQAVVIAAEAPADIRDAGKPQPPQDAPAGLPADKLTSEQQAILRRLIEVYAGNMPPTVAQKRLAAIDEAGMGKTHFAWAGADRPGVGHYYRIQGPTFLIEFVNVQPDASGNPANHIHSVWRDMQGDFALPIGG